MAETTHDLRGMPREDAYALLDEQMESVTDGALIAVLDIDSAEPAAFDERDARGLEQLVRWFTRPSHVTPGPG